MRIVGGRFRGVALTALGKGDRSAQLRPTSDRVRESLFNVLNGGRYGDVVTGARVLDLFAGTGALGFEALSRGAAHASFVENGRAGQALIRGNAAKFKGIDWTLHAVDATRLPQATAAHYLVFLDPPYGRDLGAQALQRALETGWIAQPALIIWEEAQEMPAPHGFDLVEHRRYGGTYLTFLQRLY